MKRVMKKLIAFPPEDLGLRLDLDLLMMDILSPNKFLLYLGAPIDSQRAIDDLIGDLLREDASGFSDKENGTPDPNIADTVPSEAIVTGIGENQASDPSFVSVEPAPAPHRNPLVMRVKLHHANERKMTQHQRDIIAKMPHSAETAMFPEQIEHILEPSGFRDGKRSKIFSSIIQVMAKKNLVHYGPSVDSKTHGLYYYSAELGNVVKIRIPSK